jgi:thiamine-monophosphate kinase
MSEVPAPGGEFGIIARLTERLRATQAGAAGVVLGPGDDAAIVEPAAGRALLATADLLVEDRHFDLAFSTPADAGYKSLAVNVSDIAAMGGVPRFALVSLGARADAGPKLLDDLYDGLGEAAAEFGVAVVGGDLVATDRLVVSVALLGEALGDAAPVRRDGARPADALVVTGTLGAASAALALFRSPDANARPRALLDEFPSLAAAHRRGRARVREGQAAARAGATAMIDVSDGFAADVGHICERSGVGVVLDRAALPLAPGVREAADALGVDASGFALSGGDDYELAIAIAPERVEELRAAIAPVPLTVAGRFTRAEDGEELPRGWDHFA